jgi:hypothetical protein
MIISLGVYDAFIGHMLVNRSELKDHPITYSYWQLIILDKYEWFLSWAFSDIPEDSSYL